LISQIYDQYKGKGKISDRDPGLEQERERERVERIHLGKGKWPDDFLDIQTQSKPRAIPSSSRTPDQDNFTLTLSPQPISPPRKFAIVGARALNDSHKSSSLFPRRPMHRARPSLDDLKDYLRDCSPDGIFSTSNEVILRRHSTKPNGQQHNDVYLPRGSLDDLRNASGSGDFLVPFPEVAGGHGHRSPCPSPAVDSRASTDPSGPHERPRLPRGRFQSDVEGSTRRARPSSYDELGARPRRSRIESMVNLGVATSNASASDLITRDSVDESVVRKTLIIKEDGKPPTQFVSSRLLDRAKRVTDSAISFPI
jgi:hypothetical protein